MLSFWLREWLRTPIPCPFEIVTDYSSALLNAISLAFNDVNLNTYIEQCMRFLETCDHTQRPKCIIRLDIAHLLKQVCRWKCFDGKHMQIKDFYVRCTALLTKCTNVDKFRQICRNILTVANSESEEISTEIDNCFNAQQKLIKLIKSDETLYNTDSNMDSLDENLINTLDDECGNKITTFLLRIQSESEPNYTGERPNPYWCPQFGRNLLKIAKHFPLWTGVMSARIASSACSEEYFRELKQLAFKGAKCIRADKFLVMHIRSLAGAMKILHATDLHAVSNDIDADINAENEIYTNKCNISNITRDIADNDSNIVDDPAADTRNLNSCSSIHDTTIVHHANISPTPTNVDMENDNIITSSDINLTCHAYLNEMENWKGQNNTKSRGKYLTNCPDVESIHLKPKFTTTLPLLKNGNTLSPVILDKKPIMLINTCPSDAIAQTLLVGYCDWANFHHYLEQTQTDLYRFIKQLSTSGTSTKVYEERGLILNKFIVPICGTMNCSYNISDLVAKHLLKDEFSCKIHLNCLNCQYSEIFTHTVLDINVKPFYTGNMRVLESVINEQYSYNNKKCTRCKGEDIEYSIICGQLLFINIECLQ